MSDIAIYGKTKAEPTGGAGAIAILCGPNGMLTLNKKRFSYSGNHYDFYKPDLHLERPIVDGKVSMKLYQKSF